ncbi:trehalose utilization protein [Kineococcus xinjiangensis]|uniref:Trehalose utilization protein n=1 Tax=Kineococcus xinjiangensis TaxID=512762 RepID=A0A2S6II20_9ACTN|nr:ThuA domain-containing protein [Kineococcus xinjiangensis]PPK93820.1 trehalose utilization protein [Kineococcus xinjiangensis]
MTAPLRVLVWNENVHESQGRPASMAHDYPEGIHGAVAQGLAEHLPNALIRTAVLSDPEHGLSEDVLQQTDVLLWWGHAAHDEVADEVAERVQRHVLGGMGLLVLHSGHFAKVFKRLLGTTCSLSWRNDGEREVVWTVDPAHPIAQGVPNPFVIGTQEMYGEPFDVPPPDELVFVSWFSGGEVFRSGATWRRGKGRVFYFSPGDQDYPVYHHPDVRRVLANGVRWAHSPGLERRPLEVTNPQRRWDG